jgi:hypothetical protein
MRALVLFLSCIMLVTAWTGMAQAVEFGPCPEASQAAHAPVYCDGVESAADCDKDCPRHLGCHAHHVATPVAGDTLRVSIVDTHVFGARIGAALASRDLEQALRPPKA